MTLIDFLQNQTEVGELCIIRACGWITAAAWIDDEDLFYVPLRLREAIVKNDEWGCLPIVNERGAKIKIPCHYIDV